MITLPREPELLTGLMRRGLYSHASSISRSMQLVTGICRFRAEHEFGITELAHLRNVEPCKLRLYRNSLPHEELKGEVDNEAECEDKAHQRGYTDQLRGKLAGITIE